MVCQGTSLLVESAEPRRVLVLPDAGNGLRMPMQFQADKISVAKRDKCGSVMGRLDEPAIIELNGLLAAILGLAE